MGIVCRCIIDNNDFNLRRRERDKCGKALNKIMRIVIYRNNNGDGYFVGSNPL